MCECQGWLSQGSKIRSRLGYFPSPCSAICGLDFFWTGSDMESQPDTTISKETTASLSCASFSGARKAFSEGVSQCFVGQKWFTWPLLTQSLARGMNLCGWVLSEDGSPNCTLEPPGKPLEYTCLTFPLSFCIIWSAGRGVG